MGYREAEMCVGKWHAQTYGGRRMVSISRDGIRQGRLNEYECNISRVLLADADEWVRERRKEGAVYGRNTLMICHLKVLVEFSESFGTSCPDHEIYLVSKGTHNILKVYGIDEMKDAYTLLASIWLK